MNSILIIGSGFLGSRLAKYFLHNTTCKIYLLGPSAQACACESTRLETINLRLPSNTFRDVLDVISPDTIVYAAGKSSVALSIDSPSEDFDACAGILVYVIQEISALDLHPKLIFFSSAAVYKPVDSADIPLDEASALGPIAPYGVSRLIAELALEKYCSLYEIQYTILRIFSCYGEGLKSRVLWEFAQRLVSNPQLQVLSPPDATRDLIHVDDLCRSVYQILQKPHLTRNTIINVASGTSTPISLIAETALHSMRPGVSASTITYQAHCSAGNPQYWLADIRKLCALGFNPTVSIETGLQRYLQWAMSELSPQNFS